MRLALTSGTTRRQIAEHPGIGLSTLTRWLRHKHDASKPSEAPVDLHAKLKRLRRENTALKQERDILKKPPRPSSRKREVDGLRRHRDGEGPLPDQPDVPCHCYDNSMVETICKTIKSELIWPVASQSRQQAENAAARYIGGFYNPSGGIHRSTSRAPSPSSETLGK